MQTTQARPFQFSLRDLFLFVGLCGVGTCLLAPGLEIFIRRSDIYFPAVFCVLLLTFVGGVIGVWRASCGSNSGKWRGVGILISVFGCWFFGFLCMAFRIPGEILLVLAIILTEALWIWVRSAQTNRSDFRFVPSQLKCFVASIAILTACAPMLTQRSGCCHCESAGIAACKTYAEAQDIYRRTDWDGDGVLEYAQSISGAYSLYEITPATGDLTLVDSAFAKASDPSVRQPRAGYLFKVLKGQGPNAPGGKMPYLTVGPNGYSENMTVGYALIAWPARYEYCSQNSFLINNAGTVYQHDLGPDTESIVNAMTEFNPTKEWVIAE